MSRQTSILPVERIQQRIFLARGQRVMFSTDLALLYGIPTKELTQAVRRNAGRFPDDVVLALSAEERAILRTQIVTSSAVHGGHRYPLMAFTEQGVAMLSRGYPKNRFPPSDTPHSGVATADFPRAFDRCSHGAVRRDDFGIASSVLKLMTPQEPSPKKIGFGVRESAIRYEKRRPRRRS